MDIEMSVFIETIEKTMKRNKITATEIEAHTGVKRQSITAWKNGTMPSLDNAIKVIKYLGLSADDIFDIKPVQKTVLMTTVSDSTQVSSDFVLIKSGLKYIRDSKDDTERQELCDGLLRITDEALRRHRKNVRETELRKQENNGVTTE